jgi:hypothetical protein
MPPSSTCGRSLVKDCRGSVGAGVNGRKMPHDEGAAADPLGGDARQFDQLALTSSLSAVVLDAMGALASLLRSGRRVRLLVLGQRRAPVVLVLLRAPAAAAGAAILRVLASWLRLSAAITAPLGRCWLRLRAWA